MSLGAQTEQIEDLPLVARGGIRQRGDGRERGIALRHVRGNLQESVPARVGPQPEDLERAAPGPGVTRQHQVPLEREARQERPGDAAGRRPGDGTAAPVSPRHEPGGAMLAQCILKTHGATIPAALSRRRIRGPGTTTPITTRTAALTARGQRPRGFSPAGVFCGGSPYSILFRWPSMAMN